MSRSGSLERDFDAITRERIREPMMKEKAESIGRVTVELVRGLPEPWDVFLVSGKMPPWGVIEGRKLIVGPAIEPLAGLLAVREKRRWQIVMYWTDPEARGKGLLRLLFTLYRQHVHKQAVVVGPFSPSGLAAARRLADKVIE